VYIPEQHELGFVMKAHYFISEAWIESLSSVYRGPIF